MIIDAKIGSSTIEHHRESNWLLDPDSHFVGNEVSDFAHTLLFLSFEFWFCLFISFFKAAQQFVKVLLIVVVTVSLRMVSRRLFFSPAIFHKAFPPNLKLSILLKSIVSATVTRRKPSNEVSLQKEADEYDNYDTVKAPHDIDSGILPYACHERPKRNPINFRHIFLISMHMCNLLPCLREQGRRIP